MLSALVANSNVGREKLKAWIDPVMCFRIMPTLLNADDN